MSVTYDSIRGTKRQQYERTRGSLELERSSFVASWQECAQFIKPRRIRLQITDRNKGDRRNKSIIDSTATFAAATLRSGMHAGITSPSRPWLRLTTPDPDLAEFPRVKEWLHTVTVRMLNVFLESNLYNALPTLYGDMGVFGTSAMALLADDRDLIRANPYPIGSYSLGVSRRGIVDTFVREYQMTVRQIVEEFLADDRVTGGIDWSRVSQTVKNLWDNGNYDQSLDVCWIVAPNPEKDASKLAAKYKPFASCYFEKGGETEKYLRESGFDNFPVIAPRWDVGAEEIYATEWPGLIAIGDTKGLQLMQKRKAQAVEKMVNPPIQGPTSMTNQKVSLLPGDLSFVDEGQYGKGIRAIHEVPNFVGDLREDIEDTRFLIRRAFHEDLFLMLANRDNDPDMTATEVIERREEKFIVLGPTIERTEEDGLKPLVDLTYAHMEAAGEIPPPPEELEGVRLKVVFTSVMAQAQKLIGVGTTDRFMQSMLPLAERSQEVAAKIDWMEVVDEYGDGLGVNPKLIVPTEEARQRMAQAQQMAQQQHEAEQAQALARAGKDLGTTPMSGDTALNRVLEGVQG